jgi:hypothetical protein
MAQSSPSPSLAQSNRQPPPTLPVIQYRKSDDSYCRLRSPKAFSNLYPSHLRHLIVEFGKIDAVVGQLQPLCRLLPTKTSQPACSRIDFQVWSTPQSSCTQHSQTDRRRSVVLVSHGLNERRNVPVARNVPDRSAERNEPSREFRITS